jgi:hypothetical protein
VPIAAPVNLKRYYSSPISQNLRQRPVSGTSVPGGCVCRSPQRAREKSLVPMCSEFRHILPDIPKGVFGNGISRFESWHPSQRLRSLLLDFKVCENLRHSRGLGRSFGVSGRQFRYPMDLFGELPAPSLWSIFFNFRFGLPQTGSIISGDWFARRSQLSPPTT